MKSNRVYETTEPRESFETKLKRRALNYCLKGDVANVQRTLQKLDLMRALKLGEETKMKYFVAWMGQSGPQIDSFDTRDQMIAFVSGLKRDGLDVLCTWAEPLK